MDERTLTAVLAALFREVGRLDPAKDGSPRLERSAAIAREVLGGLPSVAPLSDAVAAAIASGAEAAPAGEAAGGCDELVADLKRVQDGPEHALISAFLSVLGERLSAARLADDSGASLFDVVRLNAACAEALSRAGAAQEPFFFVRGRLEGAADHLLRLEADGSLAAGAARLLGRAARLAALESAIIIRLLGATGASPAAVLASGGGTFQLLVAGGDEPPAPESALQDAGALLARLDGTGRQRAATPFLEVLGDAAPLGPFGAGMASAAEVRAAAEGDFLLGRALGSARFAVLREGWPPEVAPLAGADERSCVAGGRFLFEPASVPLVLGGEEEPVAPAVACCRVRHALLAGAPQGGQTLLSTLAAARSLADFLRLDAARLGRELGLTLLRAAENEVIALGSLQSVLSFAARLADQAGALPGRDSAVLDAGVAAAVPGVRPAWPLLAREAQRALARAATGASAEGRSVLFGAELPTADLGGLIALGNELLDLARAQPGPLSGLFRAALRVGPGNGETPLAAIERVQGRIHEIAAQLGVNARALRGAERGDERLLALKSLLRGFPRLFESGAARVPLAYAVLMSQRHARESRP
ncbi:MAG: hypothetical protein HY812_07675 [Planctomycetes bacterium]|nr:hypothetical protein [Planctomycetota bacterium]